MNRVLALVSQSGCEDTPRWEVLEADSPLPGVELGQRYVTRDGKQLPADAVFEAWTSGDLARMAQALDMPTNPIDRHMLLLNFVMAAYKRRDEPGCREALKLVAQQHLEEFDLLEGPVVRQADGFRPGVPSFRMYVTVLAEDGEYAKALDACERAEALGVEDGTKGGWAARKQRIEKQAAKKASGRTI